jgi:hypothetical protein
MVGGSGSNGREGGTEAGVGMQGHNSSGILTAQGEFDNTGGDYATGNSYAYIPLD